MEKFIPYEKLSKKERRKVDLARRQTWGDLNPVTRKPENSRAYNRSKARNWNRDGHESGSGFSFLTQEVVGSKVQPLYYCTLTPPIPRPVLMPTPA